MKSRRVGLALLLLFPLLVGFRWPWQTARLQREAAESFAKGAYGHAAEVWGELYQGQRGDPKLAYNLGTAKLAQKQYADAIEVLGQGLEHTNDPQTINELRYNRGNAYYRLDDLERAAAEYEAALKADPEDEDAAFNLALCRRKQQPPSGGGGSKRDPDSEMPPVGSNGKRQEPKESGGMTEEQVDRMLDRLKQDEESFRTYFTPRPSITPQAADPTNADLDDVMRGLRGEGRERDW